VVLECPASLVGLFSTCAGIDALIAEKQPLPAFDVQVPLMSLPGLLGTTVQNVPGRVPYLSAEPERVARCQHRLPHDGRLRVGIVWQGNPRFRWDHWRSAPLAALAPLAQVEGVELVSLQHGPGAEQFHALGGRFAVTRQAWAADGTSGGFQDTAALLKCLDLLVCVDTAAGHLAGALGVPVWLALAAVSDWRWLRQRDDTPWYPGMRLFRQKTLGEWSEVFAAMAWELTRLVKARRSQGSTAALNGAVTAVAGPGRTAAGSPLRPAPARTA
jgi:hypothetical protein